MMVNSILRIGATIKNLFLMYKPCIGWTALVILILAAAEGLIVLTRYTFVHWPIHFGLKYEDNICLDSVKVYPTVECFILVHALSIVFYGALVLVICVVLFALYWLGVLLKCMIDDCRNSVRAAYAQAEEQELGAIAAAV